MSTGHALTVNNFRVYGPLRSVHTRNVYSVKKLAMVKFLAGFGQKHGCSHVFDHTLMLYKKKRIFIEGTTQLH